MASTPWTKLGAVVLSALVVNAADVNYQFNVVNAATSPDGFSRIGALVNGVFPGTLIQASKNDVLHINVSNQLTNPDIRRSTSIHWHGLFQHRTASEDGPAFVTQCPIGPGSAYTYDIPLNGQAGTFWYHSHLSSQYADGLRGALVVYDPNDPHASLYDEDNANTVITLDDWYHRFAVELGEEMFSDNNGGGKDPVPDSGLINGRGRFIGGSAIPWSVINVVQGKRYRFRIINSSTFGHFTFAIQGHRMTVIEVDGISHQPLTVDRMVLHAAQRYSVVVNANQSVGNYWISAPMEVKNESENDNLDGDNVHAILRYAGAPAANPPGNPPSPSGVLLQENNLKPLENPGAPGGSGPADRVIDLDFTKTKDDNDVVAWTINGIQYKSPNLPTLLKILANGATVDSDFTPSEHTLTLANNIVVELRIHGSNNGHIHPFHLHGHVFDVIKSTDGGPNNYVDPPRRDVVGVGGGGVIIRFRTDNPGPWFLHCHIDWHLEAGLAVVFAEAPQQQRTGPQSQIVKPTWQALCPAYNALPPSQQ